MKFRIPYPTNINASLNVSPIFWVHRELVLYLRCEYNPQRRIHHFQPSISMSTDLTTIYPRFGRLLKGEIVEKQVKGNMSISYIERVRFRMQKRHRPRYRATQTTVSSHCLRESRGLQPDSLSISTQSILMTKVFIHFYHIDRPRSSFWFSDKQKD